MKFFPGDLKKLRVSLTLCVLMVAGGGGGVFFSQELNRSAQRERAVRG